MTKKFKFTSLASYVFLALAFAAFFACNLGTKVSSSLAVEEGVTLKSYDYAWHLMSLLSGRMFSTNHNIAIVGWALIAATVIALIALLFNKKGYSRRMFEIEAVQVVACLFITLGFIFIFRHFNWLKQYNSYNGRKIVYLGWIICFVLYCITQGLAYLFTLFRKGDAVAETAPVAEKAEEPVVEEKPVEEEKIEEPVEETPVEEEKPAEEEKVEEPVEETPVEEPAPVEEVKEEPVVETAVVAAVVATDETEEEKIKREKVTFEQRLAKADPSLVDAYHEIRNEIMSYGIKSRVSSSGDTFRLHTVKYMKIVVAGKKLKLYMKLDPKAYDDTPIPHGDASSKNAYVEIPFVFKVKSDLSIKRAKALIADMMKEAGFEKKEIKVEEVEETEEETPVEDTTPIVAPVEEEPVEEEIEETEDEEVEETEVEEVEDVTADDASAPKVKREKVTFEQRLAKADPSLVEKYNDIKNEIMSYGVKSRVSSSGDTFRLHTVKYMKMVVAGKKIKLYMKLNPKDYDDTPIPHGDASTKNAYAEIPFVFKVNSDLSVKRAKNLIADMMNKAGLEKKSK